MIEIVRERIVDAPVNRVWELIHSVDRLPEWFSGIQAAVSLGGEGLGRRQRTTGSWGKRQFEIDQTITQYEPGRILGWRHDAERLDGKPAPQISRQTEFRVHLHPVDKSTRVALTSRQVPGNVLKGLLIRFIAAPRIARMLDRSLDNMVALLVIRSSEAGGGLTSA